MEKFSLCPQELHGILEKTDQKVIIVYRRQTDLVTGYFMLGVLGWSQYRDDI